MKTGYQTLAGIAYFFRDGAAYTKPNPGGNVARDKKPGADDPAWLNLGHVDIKTKPEVTSEEIKRNVPGRRMLYDVLHTETGLTHTITFHELQNLLFELLFQTEALDGAGQYNPGEGEAVKGWLKVQEYNDKDELINTHDVFVYLAPPSDFTRDEKHVKCDVEAKMLFSPYNTGSLAANA